MFSILENSRLLQDSINHEVKKAGYKYSPTTNDLKQYPQEFGFQKGESIVLRNNKILFYRFYAEDNDDFISSFDCTGMDLKKERKLYYVRIRHIPGNQVTCKRFTRDAISRNPNTLAGLDALSDPVVLANRIENLHFWAGMDDDDDGYVDFFLPGDKFQEKARLGDVVALRYKFDVLASDQVVPSTSTDSEEMDFSQKLVRTPFDRIIYLRN
jgi:hypothetical protein